MYYTNRPTNLRKRSKISHAQKLKSKLIDSSVDEYLVKTANEKRCLTAPTTINMLARITGYEP